MSGFIDFLFYVALLTGINWIESLSKNQMVGTTISILQHFRLKTFGTTSSHFLATKVLLQIGKEDSDQYPDASYIIQNHFYIDDLLYRHNDLDKALRLQRDFSEILSSCGFRLRK